MKIRIIGVKSCKRCCALVNAYTAQKVEFEYWDGEKDELQNELDKMNINDFPVIQIVDYMGVVLWQTDPAVYRNGVSYKKVQKAMSELQKNGKK